jgi:hypothetical protein
MTDKKRSVRGQVRRRGQKKKKDAEEQRIEDMIRELSTTESVKGYPFGVKRLGSKRFYPFRREPEITIRRNWAGAPLQERRLIDPIQSIMDNPISPREPFSIRI